MVDKSNKKGLALMERRIYQEMNQQTKGKYVSRILKFFIIICVCIDLGGCGRESNYDDINILYHADDGEYIEVRDAWSVVANETLETARQKGKTERKDNPNLCDKFG